MATAWWMRSRPGSDALTQHAQHRRRLPRHHRLDGVREPPLHQAAHGHRRDGGGARVFAAAPGTRPSGRGLGTARCRGLAAPVHRLRRRAHAGHVVVSAFRGRAAHRPERTQGLSLAGGWAGRAGHAAVHSGGGVWPVCAAAVRGPAVAANVLPAIRCAHFAHRSDRGHGHPEVRQSAARAGAGDRRGIVVQRWRGRGGLLAAAGHARQRHGAQCRSGR